MNKDLNFKNKFIRILLIILIVPVVIFLIAGLSLPISWIINQILNTTSHLAGIIRMFTFSIIGLVIFAILLKTKVLEKLRDKFIEKLKNDK